MALESNLRQQIRLAGQAAAMLDREIRNAVDQVKRLKRQKSPSVRGKDSATDGIKRAEEEKARYEADKAVLKRHVAELQRMLR